VSLDWPESFLSATQKTAHVHYDLVDWEENDHSRPTSVCDLFDWEEPSQETGLFNSCRPHVWVLGVDTLPLWEARIYQAPIDMSVVGSYWDHESVTCCNRLMHSIHGNNIDYQFCREGYVEGSVGISRESEVGLCLLSIGIFVVGSDDNLTVHRIEDGPGVLPSIKSNVMILPDA
jgi:hypothetical protein